MKKGLANLWLACCPLFFYFCLVFCSWAWGGIQFSLYAPLLIIKQFPWPAWLQHSFLGSLCFAGLLLVFNPFSFNRAKDEYGGAHFADKREIKKQGLLSRGGLIIGMKRFGLGRRFLRLDAPLSVLIHAGPGSGKTAGIILPALLSCNHSAVVHDSKGEICDLTHGYRSTFSHIIKFAPGEQESAAWNPLAASELPQKPVEAAPGLDAWRVWWEKVETAVERLAVSLLPPEKEGDDHWTRSARSIFTFWALLEIYEHGETSIPSILKRALMGNRQGLIEEALINHEDDEHLPERITMEGTRFRDMEAKQFDSCMGTFEAKTQVYLSGTVARNVSKSDFSIRQLRKVPTTIYLIVKESDQERLKGLLSAFFESASLILKEEKPKNGEQNITFFLDEFVRLAKMNEVLVLPATGRGYGINCIYVAQSYEQLVKIYGPHAARELIDTCTYRIVFSQSDARMCKEISDSIGNRTRRKITKNQRQASLVGHDTTDVAEGVPLLLPQEIGSLNRKNKARVLILTQGHMSTPIDAAAPFFFKTPALKRLCGKAST